MVEPQPFSTFEDAYKLVMKVDTTQRKKNQAILVPIIIRCFWIEAPSPEENDNKAKGIEVVKESIKKLEGRKFLGFMISSCGIEANPDKVKSMLDMKPLWNIKEVQRLIECIAALAHFISKSADKCQPFFHVLRKRA